MQIKNHSPINDPLEHQIKFQTDIRDGSYKQVLN